MQYDTEDQTTKVTHPPVIAQRKGIGIVVAAIVLFFCGNVCLYQGFYDGLTIVYLLPTYGPGFLLLIYACAEKSFGQKIRLVSLGVLILSFFSIIATGMYADKYREPPAGWGQASNSPAD